MTAASSTARLAGSRQRRGLEGEEHQGDGDRAQRGPRQLEAPSSRRGGSRYDFRSSRTARRPTGTFTQKTERHPRCSVSSPPITGPTTEASPQAPVKTLWMVARSSSV